MSVITQQEQDYLREKGKNVNLYLSIYQPTTVLACQVNDVAIAKGERTITFDTVSSGSWTGIKSGMTLRVGTAAGLDDKGTVRVRSATSSTLLVAENSHINWSDNDYLTVINFYEINAVYPRLVQSGTDVEFYKDYDITYTDQNTNLGSFIVMGNHHAGFLDGGSMDVYYSASGTVHVGGESLIYHWNFEGGSPSTFVGRDPGTVTYSSPGHYTTSLTVSGTTSGVSDSSYRHVSVYDRPEDGTSNPILGWSLDNLQGDRSKGGWVAKITVRNEDLDSDLFKPGSLVVIFQESWYGGAKVGIGGNSLGRQDILFAGYILKGSVTFNYADSAIEFEAGSPTEIMKLAEGFSISVEDSTDPGGEAASNADYPSGWVLLKDMNVRRAIFHYLRWHTTVLNCIDVRYIGNDVNIQYFDADRTSIFDAVNSIMSSALLGSACSDRQGTLFLETPIWFSEETAFYNTNMGIDSRDWMDEPSIGEQLHPFMSFAEMGGIAWSGDATGTFSAHLTAVPGTAPGYRGSVERRQGLAIKGQAWLNTLGGDYYAYQNRRYEEFSASMIWYYPNMDIAPQEFIPLTINLEDNNRRISFDQKNFIPVSIGYSYFPQGEFMSANILLTEHTSGFASDTIPVPDVPVDSETGGNYNTPTFYIPPFSGGGFSISVGGTQPILSTPDYVYNVSGGAEIVYSQVYDAYPMDNGKNVEAQSAFAVPPGVNGISVYAIMMVRNSGVASGDAWLEFVTSSYPVSDVETTPLAVSTADAYTVPNMSATNRRVSYLVATMQAGVNFEAGDVVNWLFRRDASSDPPDTYTGNMGFIGILVVFS